MALKFEVESLDGLDEAQKALYTEKDGKYRLAVEGIPEPENVDGLKTALAKERKAAADAAKMAKKYEGLGLTAEEIAELVEEKKKTDEDKAKKAGEWDKLRAQMNAEHEKKLSEKDSEITKRTSALEKYLIESAATSAIAAAKGVPALLLPHVMKHMKVVEEDGDFKAVVTNAKGEPRVDGKGEPLTIDALIAEMKADVDVFGRAFESSGQSGGGTRPNNDGGKPLNNSGVPKSWAEATTDEEKVAYLKHKRENS